MICLLCLGLVGLQLPELELRSAAPMLFMSTSELPVHGDQVKLEMSKKRSEVSGSCVLCLSVLSRVCDTTPKTASIPA